MFRMETDINHTMQTQESLLLNGDNGDAVETTAGVSSAFSQYFNTGGLVADSGDGLSLTMGGNATAVGEDTLATGQMDGQVLDLGPFANWRRQLDLHRHSGNV